MRQERNLKKEAKDMKQILSFDGQEVTWDEENGILYTFLNEPFHSAGMIYGWQGNPKGLGINKKIVDFGVKEYATLCIHVEGYPDYFYIDAIDWKDFCLKSNSIYEVDNNISLYVMQWSTLDKFDEKKYIKSSLISEVQTKIF